MNASQHAEEHRHGRRVHSHPHAGAHRHVTALRRSEPLRGQHGSTHTHSHGHSHGLADGQTHGHSHGLRHGHSRGLTHGQTHGHSHGLVDDSVKRSRAGIRAVLASLGVLGLAAAAQTVVLAASGSVALLADVIHNFGDALTAVPLGIAFALRSRIAERRAGMVVVAAIFFSACVAAGEAIDRLVDPRPPAHLALLALAGAIGCAGNFAAARIRTAAGERLSSPALIADGHHARADAYVSLTVIASAVLVALGLPVADPILGLAITLVILRITWQSWVTIRDGHPGED
ncbi:MAG TPA: cation diffusion facilitator family transporter [Solirubrobacteraceae bacterium]|nr:cation diffusion facilitator family transporter [Solirubrobacteraceae bacterium]